MASVSSNVRRRSVARAVSQVTQSTGLASAAVLTAVTRRLQSTSATAGAAGTGPSVVVAGCGVAGASTAMHLSRRGARVTLVDPRPPLTATSQYSTECYRNFFMDEALVPFMTRSVQIMEELAGEENAFGLNRRGYCFLTGTASGGDTLTHFAETASGFGGGPVRVHRQGSSSSIPYKASPPKGFNYPDINGFDIVHGNDAIREIFPFVSKDATAMLHARQCGWMSAQGLGQAMLESAKHEGKNGGSATVVSAKVAGFDMGSGGKITAVRISDSNGGELPPLQCDAFVNASGAWIPSINELMGAAALPLENEIHAKVILNDTLGVIPQDTAPFMVWRDKVELDWNIDGEDMSESLLELDDTREGGIVNSAKWLTPQPGGQHLRPAGNGRVLMLWEHLHRHIDIDRHNPEMPVSSFLDMYPELCISGLKSMVPSLGQYHGAMGKDTTIDGGYYTVSPDGRPIIGQHGPSNAFVCGGMGTYGLMGSPSAGELAALHVLQEDLPSYAGACTWPRQDPLTEKPIDLLDDSA
eukprot:TRINITY_DN41751_c2_g1_i3.p1 TRINITY_DN41751_c2_g1~~TRINITY_DN41751_c2_g1_i3.p1  ORF type:complete len:527 (-),score=88.06 TRINITY_DN41751_c2_g1_i3:87-1667(-)